MPSVETMGLLTDAVLWPFAGHNSDGDPVVGEAVAILSRWELRRREFVDEHGVTIAVDADVMVDRVIAPQSLMWKGGIEDLPDEPTSGLYEVVHYDETPDIKLDEVQRNVVLRRWKNTMPRVI